MASWLRSRRCRGKLVKMKEVPWPLGLRSRRVPWLVA